MTFRSLYRPVPAGLVIFALACGESTAPADGVLDVTVSGAPAGAVPSIVVTGPEQYVDTVAAGSQLTDLAAGSYTLRALPVAAGEHIYAAETPVQTAEIDRSTRSVAFQYALASGRIEITVTGVPSGFQAPTVVTGPGQYVHALTGVDTLRGLLAGDYLITATPIDSASHMFAPAQISRPLAIAPDTALQILSVNYGLASARLRVDVSGLPAGTDAAVEVTGPAGFQQTLTATDSLVRLFPGRYRVRPSDVTSADGHVFGGSEVSLDLAPDRATVPVAAPYAQTSGTIALAITGLPTAAPGSVTVTGPGQFTQAVFRTDTLVGLAPGTYTIAADTLVAGGVQYAPPALASRIQVQAPDTTVHVVDYQYTGSTTLNVSVAAAYLSQAIQRIDGSVPLVAGRDAFLRVFLTANEQNYAQPRVVVRLFQQGALFDSVVIDPIRPSTPLDVRQNITGSSWNLLLPGSLIVENLSFLVVADDQDLIPETDEADNVYPASGVPVPVDVRVTPVFGLTVVPMTHPDGTGNVTAGNLDDFLNMTRRLFPIGAERITLHAPFTSSAGRLESDDANSAWSQSLSEIRALKSAEGSPDYYYGVLHTTYTSGIAGLGYVPSNPDSPFRASVGWDFLPSGSEVMAHELGHNFGRRHAPCGGPANVDPGYPHPGADIGHYGVDIFNQTVKVPTLPDIMSYCNNPWISDYTWEGVLDRRVNSIESRIISGSGGHLLVWGRITPAGVILEPAFAVDGPALLPQESGPYRVVGATAGGGTAFDVSFAGVEVADLPTGTERHFAFRVPVQGALADLSAIRLSGPGTPTVERISRRVAGAPLPAPDVTTALVDANSGRIEWDGTRYPMVMVRDAVTGEVLAFARGGAATLRVETSDVRLVFSDGVTGPSARVRLERQ